MQCSSVFYVCFLCLSLMSATTGSVQQGDIECALLKQQNKHHHCLSYTVSKGNISFLQTRVPDANETHVCRLLNVNAVVSSCTDGTMSVHDEYV